MYKDEGNQWMKKKHLKKELNSAYDCYSYALKFLDDAYEKRQNHTEDEKDMHEDLDKLKSLLLSNRAQASFTLKNYRFCLTDCITSIAFWNKNIKAHFRKCKVISFIQTHTYIHTYKCIHL
jgi:hypothetical protein